MKVVIILFVLAGSGFASAGPLFTDDFESGLSEKWLIKDFQEVGGKWDVVEDGGNKFLQIDATASWTLASYPGVASLKDHENIWARVRFRMDSGGGSEVALGLLTSADDLQGNWYVGFVDNIDLGIDENNIAWHNRVPIPFAFEMGEWYILKVAVIGETLYGKMWHEGEDEPQDWLTQQDVTTHLDNDGVGFVTYHDVVCFDDLIVSASEDSLVISVNPEGKLAATWGDIRER